MVLELKLGAKDLAEYGGPEWLRFDPDELANLGYDELAAIESDMLSQEGLTTTLYRLLSIEWRLKTLNGIRALFWVARRRAGLTSPGWADFKPNPLACEWREVGADADPPDGGSSEPPSEKHRSKRD